ncbi:hypothetical protein MRX96_037027 [Rhipicephalus microplus]
MYRFKSSKYKNATPKVPKKGEGWVLDISVGGGSLGVLSLEDTGKKSKNCPLLHAHSEFITDFEFCPYDDGLLATCSHDATVSSHFYHGPQTAQQSLLMQIKIWRIPDGGIVPDVPQNPELELRPGKSRIENLSFNPAVDCLLASATDNTLQIWDLVNQSELGIDLKHDELVQSLSWRGTPSNSLQALGHANNRDSRVLWLGHTDYILSSGLGSARERQVCLRDVRRFDIPCTSWSGNSAMGVYIPLYDPDTNMLFLAAKGDTTVNFWEVTFQEPFLSEASKYIGEVQTKGVGLVPKRALNVMEGEVNRVLILGQDCIVPIPYQGAPQDVFPDTQAPSPATTVPDWLAKIPCEPIPRVSLDPAQRPKEGLEKDIDLVPDEYSYEDFGDNIIQEKPIPVPKPAPRTKVSRPDDVPVGNTPAVLPKTAPRTRSSMASTGPSAAPQNCFQCSSAAIA